MKAQPPMAEPVKAEPVLGAGFDPAFVPGITGPTPLGGVTKSPEPKGAEEPPSSEGASFEPVSPGPASSEPASAERADADEPDAEETDADERDAEDKADGPVFEASDRRARIVADRKGVRLSLDEEACEFRWDEIAAVETESPRFGKRYTITVHTPDRRWYPIEIEAAARARFKEWDEQLDAVLDAYFEEA
ncbi:hypothetical protein ACZ91_38090 [Streptomyces regensis]|nr:MULTISPECIES: hypothetical protein [Streptomyces]KMS86264.1 hypothetical protein ACZ91_38090 [Streptomyces regensis]KOG65233.1 hypothetical protein ADK77_19590 [Streptomyces antibioticus]